MDTNSLLCTEVMDFAALARTPERRSELATHNLPLYPELPPTVPAVQDTCQLQDARVLQNLLRNEDRSIPHVADYLASIQKGSVTSEMRKIVADWMLEVIHEQQSSPDVFSLAMNLLDRFLSMCRVGKAQLQLLGSVCILIASKVREPCPIPGKTLIVYTDYSITAEELKEWELLVLYKLQWELTAITALDYLDQILPRLDLAKAVLGADCSSAESDSLYTDLRRRTETALVLCATEYDFTYHPPSLLAASATLLMLRTMDLKLDALSREMLFREMRLRLQTVTHSATEHMKQCMQAIEAILPSYLKAQPVEQVSPDSTTSSEGDEEAALPGTPKLSPEPDLQCREVLSTDSLLEEECIGPEGVFCLASSSTSVEEPSNSSSSSPTSSLVSSSGSKSPLSAVDIFTDFNTNVLQAYEQEVLDGSQGSQKGYTSNSILVS